MSYKLNKPCSNIEKSNFIVEYNHKQGLDIKETEHTIFALEKYEILDGETVLDNTENYKKEQEKLEKERIGKLTCTKRNFALMLQELGISYQRLKELITTNEQALLEWDLCVSLERNNPLLETMGKELNITPYILDKMFKYANGEIKDFKELK